jgi:pheromone receptor transcription factor
VDDADAGMNPEVDLAGDGDMDDENARRKIKIEYIEDKSRRHITFSKRKAGIMKKVGFLRLSESSEYSFIAFRRTSFLF